MLDNPTAYFNKYGRTNDLFTADEIAAFFPQNVRINAAGVGRIAKKLRRPRKAVNTTLPHKGTKKLICMRNAKKWRTLKDDSKAWIYEYEKDHQEPKYKGK